MSEGCQRTFTAWTATISISSTIQASTASRRTSTRSSFYYNDSESRSFIDFDDPMATPTPSEPLPPTRAELVQKSKKLTRLFGQPPYAEAITNTANRRHSIPVTPDDLSFIDFEDNMLYIPSAASIYESMSPEERTDEDRRKMRLKLDRLHRFLGSRVPTDLALGIEPDSFMDAASTPNSPVQPKPSMWPRRRRSSSAASFPATYLEQRIMDEFTDEEKARNVKRAIILSKKFGLQPPQSLYMPHSPSSSSPQTATIPTKPGTSGRIADFMHALPSSNQLTHRTKGKGKEADRPRTSDSGVQLLSHYEHFNHSLLSLGEIIDRDDKESLAELHQYLHEENIDIPALQEFARSPDRSSFSSKSSRRRSMPTRTSIVSIASDNSSIVPQSPEVSQFEQRRRKAAKLTQFFGVDYALLVDHVLESIEKGVQYERVAGRLDPNQTEVLMEKVRELRARGGSFSST